MVPPPSRAASGPRIYVEEWGAGEPDRPPAVLLHGFTGSSDAWGDALLSSLARDRRLLVVDLPGHGRSPAPPTFSTRGEGEAASGFEWLLARVADLVESRGIERADWVGYSMGGRIALALAVERPGLARRLVLEGASPGLESETERADRRAADEALARTIEERGIRWFVDHWMALPLFESQRALAESVRTKARERRLSNDPARLAAALRAFGTGSQPSYWNRLDRIHASTLLLTGGLDTKYEDLADQMAGRLPRGLRRTVPRVGHTVHLEAPERWLRSVEEFLGGDADDPGMQG